MGGGTLLRVDKGYTAIVSKAIEKTTGGSTVSVHLRH